MMASTIYEYDNCNELFVDTSKAKNSWTAWLTVNIPYGEKRTSGPTKYIDQELFLSEKDNFYIVEKTYLTESKSGDPTVNVIMLGKDYRKVILWLFDNKYTNINAGMPEVIKKYYEEHFE